MMAAFTENFDQITRKDKRSPALKGTAAAGAGLANLDGAGFECLVWPAKAQTAPRKKTQVTASITNFGIRFRLEVARSIVPLDAVPLDAPLHARRGLRRRSHKYREAHQTAHKKTIGKVLGLPGILAREDVFGTIFPRIAIRYSFGGRPPGSVAGLPCCP